jgi:hypothetical protein
MPVTVIGFDVMVVLAFASLAAVNEKAFGFAPGSNEIELLELTELLGLPLETIVEVELVADLLDAGLLLIALDNGCMLEDWVSGSLPPLLPPPHAVSTAIRLNDSKKFLLQIELTGFYIRAMSFC